MTEEDQLQAALSDWESEGGSAGWRPPPERPRATAPEPDRGLDPRIRRGSLGPVPAAAALADSASSAAHMAHLARLLDANRDAPVLPSPPNFAAGARIETDTDAEERPTPHEDLERQPDGVPHLVIGLTALCSVLLAAVLISMVRSGPTVGSVSAVILAVIAIPVLVFRLGAKAERERDHDHPSR